MNLLRIFQVDHEIFDFDFFSLILPKSFFVLRDVVYLNTNSGSQLNLRLLLIIWVRTPLRIRITTISSISPRTTMPHLMCQQLQHVFISCFAFAAATAACCVFDIFPYAHNFAIYWHYIVSITWNDNKLISIHQAKSFVAYSPLVKLTR